MILNRLMPVSQSEMIKASLKSKIIENVDRALERLTPR